MINLADVKRFTLLCLLGILGTVLLLGLVAIWLHTVESVQLAIVNGFFGHWAELIAAIGVVATFIRSWMNGRAVKENTAITTQNNVVAVQAVQAAEAAVQRIDDHSATINMLAQKGLEKDLFQKAIKIGEDRARTGNTAPGELGAK